MPGIGDQLQVNRDFIDSLRDAGQGIGDSLRHLRPVDINKMAAIHEKLTGERLMNPGGQQGGGLTDTPTNDGTSPGGGGASAAGVSPPLISNVPSGTPANQGLKPQPGSPEWLDSLPPGQKQAVLQDYQNGHPPDVAAIHHGAAEAGHPSYAGHPMHPDSAASIPYISEQDLEDYGKVAPSLSAMNRYYLQRMQIESRESEGAKNRGSRESIAGGHDATREKVSDAQVASRERIAKGRLQLLGKSLSQKADATGTKENTAQLSSFTAEANAAYHDLNRLMTDPMGNMDPDRAAKLQQASERAEQAEYNLRTHREAMKSAPTPQQGMGGKGAASGEVATTDREGQTHGTLNGVEGWYDNKTGKLIEKTSKVP